MAYPRFKDPYILHVDASEEGLGREKSFIRDMKAN
jgi:hypothetical protein